MATIKARVGSQNTVRVLSSSATASTRIIDASDLNSTLKTEDGMILVWDTGSSAFIMTSVIDSASTTIEGIAFFTNTTNSTLPTNGALVVSGGVGIGEYLHVGAGVSVVGIATFASDLDINAAVDVLNGVNISGVTSVFSLSIGSTQVISSGRELQNILSLDAVTTATIEEAIKVSPNEFTDLKVTGLSTFVGLATFASGLEVTTGVSTFSDSIDANGDLDVDGHTELDDLNVSGVSTFAGSADFNGDVDIDGHTELDNLNVSGVSTFAGAVDINNDVTVVGFVSVTEGLFYDDDFSAETGVGYFNTSGKLVSSASTEAAISTSEYILTTQVTSGIGTPVWTDTIDGGEF